MNFVSRKESSQSDVWSPVPEQPDSRAEIYGWGEDDESEKEIDRQPFLEFAKRKRPSKAKVPSKGKALEGQGRLEVQEARGCSEVQGVLEVQGVSKSKVSSKSAR